MNRPLLFRLPPLSVYRVLHFCIVYAIIYLPFLFLFIHSFLPSRTLYILYTVMPLIVMLAIHLPPSLLNQCISSSDVVFVFLSFWLPPPSLTLFPSFPFCFILHTNIMTLLLSLSIFLHILSRFLFPLIHFHLPFTTLLFLFLYAVILRAMVVSFCIVFLN